MIDDNLSKIAVLSKKQYLEHRRLKPNETIRLKPFNMNNQRGQSAVLETNIPISQISLTDSSGQYKSPNKQQKQSIIADCELIPTSKEAVEISTGNTFDMFKEEWTLEELLNLQVDKIPFLLEKLIPQETLVVLAGQSEIGKSTLYTQLSIAIIRGDTEFLGFKLNAVHKRVLIVSTEDGPIPLSFRANKQVIISTIGADNSKNLRVIFSYDRLEEKIQKCLRNNPVDLIVIDAFGDVFQGDINASNSVRQFLNKYVSFIREFGCAILFVHHICKGNKKQKSEKDQLLGSTGIEGKMRNVLMLSIVNDQHQLTIAKGNYVNREDKKTPLYLNFDDETLTFSRTDGPAKSTESEVINIASSGDSRAKSKPGRKKDVEKINQAIKLRAEGKTLDEIGKIIGKDKSTISKWLKDSNKGQSYNPSRVDVD